MKAASVLPEPVGGAIRIWVGAGVNQPSVHADGMAKFAPRFRRGMLCPPCNRGRSRSFRSEKTPLAIAVVGPGCADPRREKAPGHDPCHGVGVEDESQGAELFRQARQN